MIKNFSGEGHDFRGKLDQRFVPEFVEELKALTIEIQELYCQDQLPWIVGYSGGKDSTAVLQLVWNAIAALPSHQRTKPVHVISTDTRVENLGTDEWQLLEQLCKEDAMHLELMTKLLDTERQYQLTSNRSGILKDLKKCFDTSSRDKEAAIEAAHHDRDLKQAVQEGDVEAVKHLTIASPESNFKVSESPNDWIATKFGKKGEASS